MEELYRAHAATVFRFLVAMTRDVDVVEQQTVRAALSVLPETYRMVLVLADDLGMPHGEIAEVVDRSPGACRVLLHRARRAFHAAYLEEGGHGHWRSGPYRPDP